MTGLSKTEIERRALAVLEHLAEAPSDTALRTRLLATEDPAVAARVLQITTKASAMGAMPTDLPDAAPGQSLPPPERFGAFRFVSPIGAGGMGEVWRGERDDGLFEQIVAIKLIQPHLQVRAGGAFEAERRILARFDHPGIARLIDGGTTDDGRACLVMEYVDGVPFDTGCAGRPLGARIALFRQVLAAVGYAHDHLVAHGDLKPGNILVDADGRVRLLDFGISRLITDEASAFLLSGAVTSSFASPARLAGAPPSIADDVFALGRLLAVAIGGDRDPDLDAIARKAALDDGAARYRNVSELAADLDRWAARKPVTAVPRTPLYVAGKFVRRNWKTLTAATALAVVAAYAGFNYLQSERHRIEATARFEDARGAARYLLFTLYDELTDRPDTLTVRRQIAATGQHYLRRLSDSHATMTDVRLDAANGFLRLARIEGGAQFPNVGQPELARPNLEAALALAGTLTGREAALVAARTELELANNADMVDEDDRAALVHLHRAKGWIDRIAAPPAIMVAQYLTILSLVEQWKKAPARAAAAARRAQAILADDTSLEALLRKSYAAELEGDGVYLTDKMASIPKYRLSLDYARQAVARYPRSYAAHRRLGITYYDVGTILTLLSDPVEGLQRLRQSADEARRLIAFEPDDDNLRRSLTITERSLAQGLAANGQVDDGIATMNKVVADNKRRWDTHPAEYRRMRDYAVAEMGLGDMLLKYHRTAPGCDALARARAVFERMAREGHLSEVDREKQLGGISKTIADSCHA